LPFSIWNDPKTWHRRAEEARSLAELMSDPGAKESMLKVAAAYDEMAKRAEERAIIQKPPNKP
jgi:hypothetical protein